ncbi:hypothetical protein CDD83_5466 [Cordyceps sp. RAO-2017]|nr:hypothetical protein CDD83_5466 [Cordyceps sp. RAO-2017]
MCEVRPSSDQLLGRGRGRMSSDLLLLLLFLSWGVTHPDPNTRAQPDDESRRVRGIELGGSFGGRSSASSALGNLGIPVVRGRGARPSVSNLHVAFVGRKLGLPETNRPQRVLPRRWEEEEEEEEEEEQG